MVYLAIPQDSLGKSIASLQQLLSHTDTARTAGGLDMAREIRYFPCLPKFHALDKIEKSMNLDEKPVGKVSFAPFDSDIISIWLLPNFRRFIILVPLLKFNALSTDMYREGEERAAAASNAK